jgi:nicotinamidase/pyrazinamidase
VFYTRDIEPTELPDGDPARDARRLGFQVTVPLDATAFVHAHPEGDDGAIAELTDAGVVVWKDGR